MKKWYFLAEQLRDMLSFSFLSFLGEHLYFSSSVGGGAFNIFQPNFP